MQGGHSRGNFLLTWVVKLIMHLYNIPFVIVLLRKIEWILFTIIFSVDNDLQSKHPTG